MKKRALIFFSILLLSACLFALSLSAEEIRYSDFAKQGANGEDALFGFLGYSINDDGDSICAEYSIDKEALCAYESSVGKQLRFGALAVNKKVLDGRAPLDSETGKPMDISSSGKSMAIYTELRRDVSRMYIIVTGVTQEYYNSEIYLCMYIYDGSTVKYLTGESSTIMPDSVSMAELNLPTDVTVDNVYFTTQKPSSTIAYDREKQMKESKLEYGTPVVDASTYTDSKMSSVLSGAKTIAGNGFLGLIVKGMFPNASRFMAHYLENTGTDMIINMGTGTNGFFKSGSGTLAHRESRVNQALRACEALAREGKSISVYQGTEQVNHFGDTEDWYLAVGSYFTCIEMNDVTVTVNSDGTRSFSAQLTYNVTDYYNWNENSWSTIPIVNVSQRDLHQLHRTKQAMEFESSGSVTYSITWTEGQDASSLSFK
ncbi:MAG: hypothetical protein J6B29_03800 [Clostridia bacterium]|nr:hypothetical protein [Clostridia bacterium]